jgi:hypothetical protein
MPLTPGGSHGRNQPLRRPDGSRGGRTRRSSEFGGDGDANQTLENFEAQTVMRRGVFGPQDALDLLYKAATDRYVTPASIGFLALGISFLFPLLDPPSHAIGPSIRC